MDIIHNRKLGSILLLTSAFFFSTMSMFARLSGDIPVMQKLFIRNLVSIIVLSCIFAHRRRVPRIKPGTLHLHLLRSGLGIICTLGNLYAVDHMLLADATILVQLCPFFVILLSSIFLREKVRPVQYLLILLAFAGAAFVVKPSSGLFSENAALIALMSAVLGGGAYMMVRALSLHGEDGLITVFFFSVLSCIICFPSLLLHPVQYSPEQIFFLLMMAGVAYFGQYFVTLAYRYAPSSEISIFDYSQVIFAAMYGRLIFGQSSDTLSIIGYILIFAAALLMFLQSRTNASD